MSNPRGLRIGAIVVGISTSFFWLPVPSEVHAQRPEALRAQIAVLYPGVRWVAVPRFLRWRSEGGEDQPIVLDVREREEFAVSHLRGARWMSPDETDFRSLNLEPNRRIVVYCSVGYRSAVMARRLAAAGHTRVFNLEGGIFAWANRGHPVFAREGRVRRVHPYNAIWGRLLETRYRAAR